MQGKKLHIFDKDFLYLIQHYLQDHDYNAVQATHPKGPQIMHSAGVLWGMLIAIGIGASIMILHLLAMGIAAYNSIHKR